MPCSLPLFSRQQVESQEMMPREMLPNQPWTKPAAVSRKVIFELLFGCTELTFEVNKINKINEFFVYSAPRCSRSGSGGCFELLISQILPMLR